MNFVLRDTPKTADSPTETKGVVGRTPLETAWLAEFVRRIVATLSADEAMFLISLLWGSGRPRTPDDEYSKLQRKGLALPSKAKSACVPDVLTPLGHSVREYLLVEFARMRRAHREAVSVPTQVKS